MNTFYFYLAYTYVPAIILVLVILAFVVMDSISEKVRSSKLRKQQNSHVGL